MKTNLTSCAGGTPAALLVSAIAELFLVQSAVALPLGLDDYDPSGQIRIRTPAEADAKRHKLIRFIWSGGLPADTIFP